MKKLTKPGVQKILNSFKGYDSNKLWFTSKKDEIVMQFMLNGERIEFKLAKYEASIRLWQKHFEHFLATGEWHEYYYTEFYPRTQIGAEEYGKRWKWKFTERFDQKFYPHNEDSHKLMFEYREDYPGCGMQTVPWPNNSLVMNLADYPEDMPNGSGTAVDYSDLFNSITKKELKGIETVFVCAKEDANKLQVFEACKAYLNISGKQFCKLHIENVNVTVYPDSDINDFMEKLTLTKLIEMKPGQIDHPISLLIDYLNQYHMTFTNPFTNE